MLSKSFRCRTAHIIKMFAALVLFSQSLLTTVAEERSFLNWMRETNNMYTGDEYHLRLGIFLSTARFVNNFNRGNRKFKLGLNSLSALTPAEYRLMLGARPRQLTLSEDTTTSHVKAPESLDWRDKNVVTPIKDQGQCGSCWAFSAIHTAESASAIHSGTLISFSESNLVDCCQACFGCNGGWPFRALDYAISTQDGHFNTEEDYPYVPIQHSCSYDQSKAVGLVDEYFKVKGGSELDLAEKIASMGPASVCVDASPATFHQYSTGIYSEDSCSTLFLNHAVGCVGYGADGADEYWIIRNSWGSAWGENGYMRLARNKGNMCGVASDALVAHTK